MRHRPAGGTAVTNLGVAGPRRRFGKCSPVFGDELACRGVGMSHEGSDGDVIAAVLDVVQPGNPADVDDRLG